MDLLGGKFEPFPPQGVIVYKPDAKAPQRELMVWRPEIQGGPTPSPIVVADGGVTFDHDFVSGVLVGADFRVWPDGTRKEREVRGIDKTDWGTIRGVNYRGNLVVGVMLAKLIYHWGDHLKDNPKDAPVLAPGNFTDYVVSFAANLNYHKGRWENHNQIKQDGSQTHAEIFLAKSLEAFITALKGCTEKYPQPQGFKYEKDRKAFSAGKLNFDADVSIDRASKDIENQMCEACANTWKGLAQGFTHKVKNAQGAPDTLNSVFRLL